MYEIFANLLKEKGVKTADVTRATGISSATFSDWKRWKSAPKQDKLMQTKAFELAGIKIESGFAAKETGERFVISEKEKPSPYNFLKNNCSQHVGKIALSGDVFTTGDLIPKLQILMDKDTFLLYEALKSMNMEH